MGQFGVGQAVRRKEDDRLIVGKGQYTDDIKRPNLSHTYMLRSPMPHARITSIDIAAAKAMPGVLAIYTGADVEAAGLGKLSCRMPLKSRDGSPMVTVERPLIAKDRVRFVGDTVAMIVAESLDQAKDAAGEILVEYDDLPFVVGTKAAAEPDAPVIWEHTKSNICVDWEYGKEADFKAALARAAHVTRLSLINNRVVVASMEPRAALGEYDPATESYTLTAGTQGVHNVRGGVARGVLKIPLEKLRVRTIDVGGGFGMKGFNFPEYGLVLWAAKLLGRPVRWSGERSDAFLTDTQGRDHITDAVLAFDADHRILGVGVETIANVGAYHSDYAPFIATMAPHGMHVGCYVVPALYNRVRVVFTNTTPIDAYRGAGRPEASYVIERLMDQAARELKVSPVELRRKNFVPASAMPYKSPTGLHLDSGDFTRNLDDALKRADWDGFPARKKERAARGLLSGIGLVHYIERTPGGSELAHIAVHGDGHVVLAVGTQSTGQGHETTWAQIVADKLGVPFESIKVEAGDTALLATGGGTGGSRSTYMARGSLEAASNNVIDKGRSLAANELEAAEADVVFEGGRFVIAGTDRAIGLFDVARIAETQASGDPAAGLVSDGKYEQATSTFPNGCHICEVEIDRETGEFKIVRYTVVDDFGKIINPLLVEGQVHGGVVQGLGQAMGELAVYDEQSGQLVTGSFMDYTLPRADTMPHIDFSYNEVLCRGNPLGIKGCGEAGTIGAPTAVINAIIDALSEFGVTAIDMPVTPVRLWEAMHKR